MVDDTLYISDFVHCVSSSTDAPETPDPPRSYFLFCRMVYCCSCTTAVLYCTVVYSRAGLDVLQARSFQFAKAHPGNGAPKYVPVVTKSSVHVRPVNERAPGMICCLFQRRDELREQSVLQAVLKE